MADRLTEVWREFEVRCNALEADNKLLKQALANKDFALMAAAQERDQWRNQALEDAALICERSQSNHRMSGPDAARRNCAVLIRDLKTPLTVGGSDA